MSMDEWRITKTTIETEMLRLADLLSVPVANDGVLTTVVAELSAQQPGHDRR